MTEIKIRHKAYFKEKMSKDRDNEGETKLRDENIAV
jgi:hypothetical protein